MIKKQIFIIVVIIVIVVFVLGIILMKDNFVQGSSVRLDVYQEDGEYCEEGGYKDDEYKENEYKEGEYKEEGKIVLSKEQIVVVGIWVDMVGFLQIRFIVQLLGEICFNEDCIVYVVLQVVGIVELVLVNLGQKVKKGQVLVVISSSVVFEQCFDLFNVEQCLLLVCSVYQCEKYLWEQKIFVEQDYL